MTGIDTSENLSPFRDAASDAARAEGAILFDAKRLRQADPHWFDPTWWGERAEAVGSGGRGGAWFVPGVQDKSSGFGPAVLRFYLRGGLAARLSRDRHLWRGPGRIRSFDEFRLLRELRGRGLPVPQPVAAIYWRQGNFYRAAILLDRLMAVEALATLAARDGADAPWAQAGRLIARCHRVGLDHADLNAHNLLFDAQGRGWVIDLDRSQVRIPATDWRERNLARLLRSLLKLRGARSEDAVRADFATLRKAYDADWQRGV